MLRALGLQKNNLVWLLLIQASIYIIPGVAIGMLVAYIINTIVCFFIFNYSNEYTTYQVHPTAIAMGVLVGTLMPLAANIIPINRALSKNL